MYKVTNYLDFKYKEMRKQEDKTISSQFPYMLFFV